MNSDNAKEDLNHVKPLLIDDAQIIVDFFRLPDETEAKEYYESLMKWKHHRTLQTCLRPGIFQHLKALSEAAPWVMEGIAPSGLRDIDNSGMTQARIICFLIS